MVKKISISLFLFVFALGLLFLLTAPVQALTYNTSRVIPSTYKSIGIPLDLISLPDQTIWFVDSLNNRLVKIAEDGTILRTVGRTGTGEGEFERTLVSITRDNSGNLYALDECHIYKFDFNGGFLNKWGECGDDEEYKLSVTHAIHFDAFSNLLYITDSAHNRVAKFSTSGEYLGYIGSPGSGDGQMYNPQGMTTDVNGKIYVVDLENARVVIFNADGSFDKTLGSAAPGDDQLVAPVDVEVLSNGDVVVTSQNAYRIKKFSSTITSWGANGANEDQFISPSYITKTSDDSIWVADRRLNRLQKFSKDGVHLKTIGNNHLTGGSFSNPYSVGFDIEGNIYVLDASQRVQKFSKTGTFITTVIDTVLEGAIDLAISPITGNIFVGCDTTVFVYNPAGEELGTLGTHNVNDSGAGDGDFNLARGMAFDSEGNVYVTDRTNNRIQVFDPTDVAQPDFNGGYLRQWSVEGYVTEPEEIFITGNTVYVSGEQDLSGLRIEKYNTSGVYQGVALDKFGQIEETDGASRYYTITGIYVDASNKIYVSDSYYNRIQVYNADTTLSFSVGSKGSDLEQFSEPRSARINTSTGDLVVVDYLNHRIVLLNTGLKIQNLIPSADVIADIDDKSLVRVPRSPLDPNITSLQASLELGKYIVSDFTVNLSQNRDWNTVNALTLPHESKALVINLQPATAPGISSEHSLYVVKNAGQTYVRVCTDAAILSDLTLDCPGYTLTQGDSQLSTVTVEGITYWKITGLTGTGALSPITEGSSEEESIITNSSFNSSVSNSSSGQVADKSCGDTKPSSSPDLFEIDVNNVSANLFFSPASGPQNKYYVSYGLTQKAEDYGVEYEQGASSGVLSYSIYMLSPNRVYYFKVRAGNGCMPGNWSRTMRIKTSDSTGITKFYPTSDINTGSRTTPIKITTPQPTNTISSNPTSPIAAPTGKTLGVQSKNNSNEGIVEKVQNWFRALIKS